MSQASPAPSQIRCPSCAAAVQMPADQCPSCRYNFRTGLKPPAAEADGRPPRPLGLWIGAGAVLAVLLVLAVMLLFNGEEKPMAENAPALPPTAAGVPDSEIGEALATFDSLTEAPNRLSSRPFEDLGDDPLFLQGHVIVDKTQELADHLSGQQKATGEALGLTGPSSAGEAQ